MRDTAEVEINSQAAYSSGLHHMDEKKQDEQLEPI